MSNLCFPTYFLTDSNQNLLRAISRDFDIWCEEEDDLTVEDVLFEINYSYHHEEKVINIYYDEYCDFEEICDELLKQKIPYDIIHSPDYDTNSSVEFYRKYMEGPTRIQTDESHNPLLKIKNIRDIIDSQDENLTDLEVMNILINKMNEYDFTREGNRIEDLA